MDGFCNKTSSSLEGCVGEAAVQVSVNISAALLHGPRVGQHHQHWRGLPDLLSLLRLQHLSHQVHSWELVAVRAATNCDTGQPRQKHRLIYLHLTEKTGVKMRDRRVALMFSCFIQCALMREKRKKQKQRKSSQYDTGVGQSVLNNTEKYRFVKSYLGSQGWC